MKSPAQTAGRVPLVTTPAFDDLSGMGVAAASVAPWAAQPDVVDMDKLKTGRRRKEGH